MKLPINKTLIDNTVRVLKHFANNNDGGLFIIAKEGHITKFEIKTCIAHQDQLKAHQDKVERRGN